MQIRRSVYPPRKKKPHVIDEISGKDYIVCACGWDGPIDSYRAHRAEFRIPDTRKR